MKTVCALLLLLTCLQTSQSYNVLTSNELVSTTWRYYNDFGYLGFMTFRVDGSIGSIKNPDAVYWYMKGKTLSLLNANKIITCTFTRAQQDYFGKWQLTGAYRMTGRPVGFMLHLEQLV